MEWAAGEMASVAGRMQAAVTDIEAVLRRLADNAYKARSACEVTMSEEQEALRARGEYLLTQVEKARERKEAALVGQLQAVSYALETLQTALLSSDLTNMQHALHAAKAQSLRPCENAELNFAADTKLLRAAIAALGSMRRGEGPMWGAGGGASLPAPFEDYGDHEHQLLHKHIRPGQVQVRIPKLSPHVEDWLFRPTNCNKPATKEPIQQHQTPSDTFDWLFRPMHGVHNATSSGGREKQDLGGSIRCWLAGLQQDAEAEDDDFEVIHAHAGSAFSSGSSSRNESVSLASSVFQRIATSPLDTWLLRPPSKEVPDAGKLSLEAAEDGFMLASTCSGDQRKQDLYPPFKAPVTSQVWLMRKGNIGGSNGPALGQGDAGQEPAQVYRELASTPLSGWLRRSGNSQGDGGWRAGDKHPRSVMGEEERGGKVRGYRTWLAQYSSPQHSLASAAQALEHLDISHGFGARDRDTYGETLKGVEQLKLSGVEGEAKSWLLRGSGTRGTTFSELYSSVKAQPSAQWLVGGARPDTVPPPSSSSSAVDLGAWLVDHSLQ